MAAPAESRGVAPVKLDMALEETEEALADAGVAQACPLEALPSRRVSARGLGHRSSTRSRASVMPPSKSPTEQLAHAAAGAPVPAQGVEDIPCSFFSVEILRSLWTQSSQQSLSDGAEVRRDAVRARCRPKVACGTTGTASAIMSATTSITSRGPLCRSSWPRANQTVISGVASAVRSSRAARKQAARLVSTDEWTRSTKRL